jgi:hypothetical protein
VVVPDAGVVTVEATATTGDPPPLEVETTNLDPCCAERMGNPTSIAVPAGTELIVNVELPVAAKSSRSFVVRTRFTPR